MLGTTDAIIKGSLPSAHVMHVYLNTIFHTDIEHAQYSNSNMLTENTEETMGMDIITFCVTRIKR